MERSEVLSLKRSIKEERYVEDIPACKVAAFKCKPYNADSQSQPNIGICSVAKANSRSRSTI